MFTFCSRVLRRCWLLVAAGWLAVALPVHGAMQGDIDVQSSQLTSSGGEFTHGYAAATLQVRNLSATRTHVVDITCGDGEGSAHRRLTVKPGESLQLPWRQPIFGGYVSNYLNFAVDGRREKERIDELAGSRGYSYSRANVPRLLVSRRLAYDKLDDRLNPKSPTSPAASSTGMMPPPMFSGPSGSGDEPKVRLLRAESEVAGWYTDWLAYSTYDGILLDAADVAAMPQAVFDALVGYAECGGVVVVFGDAKIPPGWGALRTNQAAGTTIHHLGLGSWIPLPATVEALTEPQLVLVRDLNEHSSAYLAEFPERLARLTGSEELRLPKLGISIVISLFVLLAGPVNLLFLAPNKKRIRLFWTTPLISLLFAVGLVGYYFLSEGIATRVTQDAVTVLDETSKRAVTIGYERFYAPLPPRAGVNYALDWEVTAQEMNGYRGNGENRVVELAAMQQYADGWLQPRVPLAFARRGVRHAAERLPIQYANGRMTVVNGLGAPIVRLYVVAPSGHNFTGHDIAPGAEVELKPASSEGLAQPHPVLDLLSGRTVDIPSKVGSTIEHGCYLAELSQAPFLEKGIPDATYKTQGQLVFGISASMATAGEGQ